MDVVPQLVADKDGRLALEADGVTLRGDFARLLPRLRPQNLHRELLVRAARVRGVPSPVAVTPQLVWAKMRCCSRPRASP